MKRLNKQSLTAAIFLGILSLIVQFNNLTLVNFLVFTVPIILYRITLGALLSLVWPENMAFTTTLVLLRVIHGIFYALFYYYLFETIRKFSSKSQRNFWIYLFFFFILQATLGWYFLSSLVGGLLNTFL